MTTQSNAKQRIEEGQESLWTRPAANRALWVMQGLLTPLFLFAGSMKLILPIAVMTKQFPFPGLFLRFLGVAEIAGAIGLILPWLLKIRRELTPLAASCLVVIMVGATVLTLAGGSFAGAVMPFVVGVLLVVVAYGRRSSVKASSGERKIVDFAPSRSIS